MTLSHTLPPTLLTTPPVFLSTTVTTSANVSLEVEVRGEEARERRERRGGWVQRPSPARRPSMSAILGLMGFF